MTRLDCPIHGSVGIRGIVKPGHQRLGGGWGWGLGWGWGGEGVRGWDRDRDRGRGRDWGWGLSNHKAAADRARGFSAVTAGVRSVVAGHSSEAAYAELVPAGCVHFADTAGTSGHRLIADAALVSGLSTRGRHSVGTTVSGHFRRQGLKFVKRIVAEAHFKIGCKIWVCVFLISAAGVRVTSIFGAFWCT